MGKNNIVDIEDKLNGFSIAEEIGQETEYKKSSEAISGKVKKEQLYDDDDFDKDLLQTIDDSDPNDEITGDNKKKEENKNDNDEDEPDPEGVFDASEFAEVCTDFVDMAVTSFASWSYRETIMTKRQYIYAKKLFSESELTISSSTNRNDQHDLWHMRKLTKIKKYAEEEAPLNAKEGALITKQFRRFLKEKNFEVTPAGGLGLAIASVFLSRGIDSASNLMMRDDPPARDPLVTEVKENITRVELTEVIDNGSKAK